MRLVIQATHESASTYVAAYICQRITEFGPTVNRPFVLGLPTSGATTALVFQVLVEYHRQGKLSFQNVVTFGMDEYVGLPREHPQSSHSFMWTHLFKHVDIKPSNVYLLDGNTANPDAACKLYEQQIDACGGIELFFSSAGEDGRIAQNEPGSSLVSRTRVKTLAQQTILANARYFENDMARVPKLVLTIGIGTFMAAREVVLMITGAPKAVALAKVVEEGVCQMWTASAIQLHLRATVVCDEDATLEMRVKTVKYFKSIQEVHGQVMQTQGSG